VGVTISGVIRACGGGVITMAKGDAMTARPVACADVCGAGVPDARGVGEALAGETDARGVGGAWVRRTLGDGFGDRDAGGAAVTSATGALPPRCVRTESPAPTASPMTTTASRIGISGSDGRPGFERRLRRGISSIQIQFRHARKSASNAKWTATAQSETDATVIQVAVPIDVGTIAKTGSGAFALATPMRVDELLVHAVHIALGERAPHDKRDRGIRATLAGLAAGRFVVDVDGRLFDRPDAVVVASGMVTLRFFSTEPQWRRVPAR
jgi:hypothetical protein